MPNPWIILAALLVLGGACGYSFHAGSKSATNAIAAQQLKEDNLEKRVTDAALKSAADAISQIQVRNVTTQQKLQTEIIHVPDYSQCHNSPDGLRALNDALSDTASQPAAKSGVPEASSVK